MPIVDEDNLVELIRDETISALTVDTNIFVEKGFRLTSPPLSTVSNLSNGHFSFILSGTIAREVQGHIEKDVDEKLKSARKTIGQALNAFETMHTTREQILNQITGTQTAAAAAKSRFSTYINTSNCEVLNDEELVTTKDLFDSYFGGTAPFGNGKKKSEFPDALALRALEATAITRETKFMVVSKDGDWKKFCEDSQYLYLIEQIESALSLLNDSPLIVRQSLLSWLGPEGEGREALSGELNSKIIDLDVDVNGHSSAGAMEAMPWGAEVRELNWPSNADVDIIETTVSEDGSYTTAVISMPFDAELRINVELGFSIWDSVDRESISMGGRSIELDDTYKIRATVTVKVHELGTEDQDIEIENCEIDISVLEVELGEVDMFEPEDYDIEL